MNNWNLYDQNCFTVFMHTYAYLELFKPVFSLNKQIFQLFQFIWAILRLLNHARRLKFSCCCCWCWWQHWHWSSKQTPPDKKIKNVNFNRKNMFEKPWNFAHIGFWVCQLQCTMSELCVTSTFWVVMALIISLTNAVNVTAISLIVSENWSLLVRKILKEKKYYALSHIQLYRVHCQPIISSNEKTDNQFAIDNNYLWKYPYIIKVVWNFADDKVFPYNSRRRFCQNEIS